MATLYRRGETYWLKWYVEGKPSYESLKTKDKKLAKVAKAAKELSLRTGGVSAADANCTVGEFAERYILWHEGEYPWDKRIEAIIRSDILPRLGKSRLASLDPQLVEQWKHERLKTPTRLKKPRARSMVNRELATLKALVNKAVEWGVIPYSSVLSVKPLQQLESSPRSYYTVEQLNRLYLANPRNAPIWRLLANTGLRMGEALNLRWQNVDDQKIRVLSTASHHTKNRRWRDIPISPGARAALAALKNSDEHVLPRAGMRTYGNWFAADREKAGVVGTIHELRHTFISHLVMQGKSMRVAQQLAGHSSITVTENYSHLAPENSESAVAGLHL